LVPYKTEIELALTPLTSWRSAFEVYLKPQVIAMLFLGFAAGLPYLLVFGTLSAWLTEAGISKTMIGFFSWVGLTYSIKIFWAPVVDRVPLPFVNRWLGRRRSWMLFGQLGIAVGLVGLAMHSPEQSLVMTALFALLVAFSSATQDIAIDAFRIEAVSKEFQGAMSAMYIAGYRFGWLVSGAGALYIADLVSWQISYLSMAVLISVGIITVIIVREPQTVINGGTVVREQKVIDFLEAKAHWPERWRQLGGWFIGAVVCPFTDFFQRNGVLALIILLFISVFRISDITMGVMANPFYLDMGFSKTEIANVSKFFGFVMTLIGAGFGGVLVVRYGIMRILLLGAVMVALTNLLFAYLATLGHAITMLAIVISADNLSGGIATAAFVAYLSSLTNTAYTATQYALFSSLMTLLPKFIAGFSGIVVYDYGYISFFIYASILGIPAILLVLYLMKHMNVDRRNEPQQKISV
jgi:PAT family beta-lactamase induction signal transducer AmpG